MLGCQFKDIYMTAKKVECYINQVTTWFVFARQG